MSESREVSQAVNDYVLRRDQLGRTAYDAYSVDDGWPWDRVGEPGREDWRIVGQAIMDFVDREILTSLRAELQQALAEAAGWHAANSQALASLAALEAELERTRHAYASAEAARAMAAERIGYLERMLELLRSAAAPAAALLREFDETGSIDLISLAAARAPLESVLAAGANQTTTPEQVDRQMGNAMEMARRYNKLKEEE